jgi:hypothetical protein
MLLKNIMKNPMSFSNGCLWRLFKDNISFNDKSIKKLRKLPIDGVELNLGGTERFTNFNLSKDTAKFLKTLKYNTIHFPGTKDMNEDEVLSKIRGICRLINSKNVVFHPTDLKDFNILTSYDFKASIENKDAREEFSTVELVKDFLKKHQHMSLTFDIAHGYSVYNDEATIFIDEFNDRLVECHISILKDWVHWFSHLSNVHELMEEFANKIRPNFIIVNESAVMNKEQLPLLKDELSYLRNL